MTERPALNRYLLNYTFYYRLGKKVLIANVAGELASSILNSQLMASVVEVWLGVIFIPSRYTLIFPVIQIWL